MLIGTEACSGSGRLLIATLRPVISSQGPRKREQAAP